MKTPLLLIAGFMLFSRIAFAQDGAAINWFEPSTAKPGDQVVISCRYFAGGDSTIVSFNGITAHITKNSPDHIVVIVPEGNTSGLISVSGPGLTLTSKQKFINGSKPSQQVQAFQSSKAIASVAVSQSAKSLQTGQKAESVKATAVRAEIKPGKAPQQALKAQSSEASAPVNQSAKSPTSTPVNQSAKALVSATGTQHAPALLVQPVNAQKAVQIVQPIKNEEKAKATQLSQSNSTAGHQDEGKLPQIKSEGQPLILGFSPKSGSSGTEIHISGLNFGFQKKEVSVTIKNTSLQVQSVYDQEIVVTIPSNMKDSGNLIVVVSGKKSSSKEQFRN